MEGRPPILRNSPLVSVAVEMRFPEAVVLPEDLKTLRKRLAKDYPISDTEHGLGIEISPQGVRQQQTMQRQVYKTRNGAHLIGVTTNSIVLEGRGGHDYEGFEHFLERWLDALDVVVEVAEVDTQLRLGLRYINQLAVEDSSAGMEVLVARINPALLSPFGADGFEFAVTTSFEELRLANEHGRATLRHGLQRTQEEPPAQGVYVLDIDFYDGEVVDYDRERQADQLKDFNFEIWKIFRWSVTDAEYERMEPEERE